MTYFDQLFVTSTSDVMCDEEYDLFIRGEANIRKSRIGYTYRKIFSGGIGLVRN